MALYIKTLVYNAFQVNTYVIYDESGNTLVVDPACYTTKEQEHLADFISDNNLTIRFMVNTHCHVDHVLGNGFIYKTYGIKPMIHRSGLVFYENLVIQANTFGFEVDNVIYPDQYLEDGDEIILGDERLTVSYTPGHAEGSICLVYKKGKWIVTGDLLFYMSIGRTDLPTGSLETLLASVRNKVFIYSDDYIIYPGHGQSTSLGFERKHNPYL